MTPLTRPAAPTPRRASATHGAALTFETLVEGQAAHDRLRMHDDTLLRVVAGIVRLTIDAEAHWLRTGDEIVIPADLHAPPGERRRRGAHRHRPARGPPLSASTRSHQPERTRSSDQSRPRRQ